MWRNFNLTFKKKAFFYSALALKDMRQLKKFKVFLINFYMSMVVTCVMYNLMKFYFRLL
jgi:hypothetical protein